ncbi:YihY/virulence factor BrkB family protein [Microbacterium sp. NPDC089321]|uniref:YihY/virulence factor BrkB family protein n=1 Tax=Microbacterium sp. NPDC089321 TaxID=3155183 RepID=UPI0034316892
MAALFPVRVWRRFLRRNGFLLSAGMAYQALFALSALIYVTFAVVGVWLGGSEPAVEALIRIANSYLPGIIDEAGTGLATPDDVREIAVAATSSFTVTGAIAAAVSIWAAIGAVTFTRRAVRNMFGLPFDSRSYLLLKLRDALGALAFGIALLAGAVLSVAGVWALGGLLELLGWQLGGVPYAALVRASSVLVIVSIDATAIALLVRFLTGTSIRWRRIWPGATLGGVLVAASQLGAGLLFAHSPGNPLLATFAVMVALLLWCRIVAVLILLAATWIALSAHDRDEPLERPDPAAEQRARLVEAERRARERVRAAGAELQRASWWRRRARRAELLTAQAEWADAAAELDEAEQSRGVGSPH